MANGRVTIEEYVDNAPGDMYKFLFWELRKRLFDAYKTDIEEYAIFMRYVAYKKKYNFVSLWIKSKGLIIETKRPRFQSIGENIPDTHRYTLDYRMIIENDSNLDEVMKVIHDSYLQTR